MTPQTPGFAFRLIAKDGEARRAVFETPHGAVDTPTFMPVGTQGSVKTLTPDEVASTGAQVVLGNTYHLMLRPGAEVIADLGGLHAFTRWSRPMLTDSGGFQAYSLATPKGRATLVDAGEEGFVFKSHIDGTTHRLTPEDAVRIQGLIGADIQMQLDICPPGDSPRGIVEQAVERTTRWARRALAVPRPERQAMFGIVQGALWLDLRLLHAQTLAELPFDGLALGGFSVGESNDRMHETLSQVVSALDPQRPRYVMGIGTPRDIVRAICAGADMFDCVMPTRNARNGQAFTRSGRIVIKQARFRNDPRPLDEDCTCACCSRGYSRAYLRHLYLAREVLCLRLLSLHNLHFYGSIVSGARAAIEGHRLAQWSATTLFAIDEGVA